MRSKLKESTLYAYRHGLAFAFFNGITWTIVLGNPIILIANYLEASTVQVGLVTSFQFLMLPLQVLATILLPYLGYKRQMVSAWVLRTFCLLVPIMMAITARNGASSWMADALVWSVLAFCLLRAVGYAAFYPWLYDLVPEDLKGRYFATDQSFIYLASLGALLGCFVLFGVFEEYMAYVLVYGLTIVTSIMSIAALFRLKTVSKVRAGSFRDMFKHTPELLFKPSPFRHYLIITVLWTFAGHSFIPFSVNYLKVSVGLTDNVIIFYTVIQFLGSIIAGVLIRGVIDQIGVKPLFLVAMTCFVGATAYWILFVGGVVSLGILMPVSFFVMGIGNLIWYTSHYKYIDEVSPKKNKALGVALQTAFFGIAGGVSPIIMGYLFSPVGDEGGMNSEAFLLYLVVSTIVMALLTFPILKLGGSSAANRDEAAFENGVRQKS